ncbi:DnaJ domain-containing protein, partial [Schizophyllum commune]
MATQLYEVLEIRQDASPEEVRKAYKRLALKTHPDRLPPGSTSADKAAAEEKFRQVNNAYEILSNEESRKVYDQFGVFPPPTAEPNAPSSSSRSRRGTRDPFDDPFFSGAGFFGGSPFGTREGPFGPRGGSFFPDPFANDPFFSRRTRGFTFTDPFELFDAFFGVPRERSGGSARADPFSGFGGRQDPFGAFGGLFGGMGSSMLALPSAFGNMGSSSGSGSRSYSMMSSGFGSSSGGGWTSESVSTTTVNGVTTTVREKRDAQGNVHRTKIYPDGREVYTINGVEQKKIDSGENKRKALEDGPSSRKRGNGGGERGGGSGERGGGDGALPPPARGDSMESSSSSEPYSSRPSSSLHHSHHSHHTHHTSSHHRHSGTAK